MRLPKFAIVGFLAFAGLGFASSAMAHDQAASCDNERILKSIAHRFYHQTIEVHDTKLSISEISNVHEHRSYAKSEFSPIARRYCGATATLSDGRNRTIWYLIEGDAGLAGLGNGVEFCVSGFDRWNVYNASCRVLR